MAVVLVEELTHLESRRLMSFERFGDVNNPATLAKV